MSITIPKRPKRYFVGDFAVWAVFFSLCIISLVEVYSAGTYLAIEAHSYFSPLVRQISYLALAALAAFVVQFIHFRYVYHLALLGGVASFLLLLATYFIGQNINNGTRWISIFGLSIQPSELNKLCVILYATAFMANAQKPDGTTRKVAFSVLFPTFVSFAMIAPQNLSTALLLVVSVFAILFIGNVPWRNFLKSIGIFSVMAVIMLAGLWLYYGPNSTATQRFTTWSSRLEKKQERPKDPREFVVTDKNRQVTHANIAFARSNVYGRGPGNSVQRDYLAAAYSDFIFAIIGEELGLTGCFLVVLLYMILFVRTYYIAKQCSGRAPAFIVMGIGTILLIQAFANMAVAVGLAPVTGQPLPLVSKGGSSNFITGIYFGIILSISHYARTCQAKKATKEEPEA